MQGGIGLELAREYRPDLILLDLHLPDMNGDEVLARLLADPLTAVIPVVMLSADATPEQRKRLPGAGASNYLTKPTNVRDFFRVLDSFQPLPNQVLTGSSGVGSILSHEEEPSF